MSVIRFTYPSNGPFGGVPLDFEFLEGTSVVRHVRARNGAGGLTGGPPKRVKYLPTAAGVAAVDLADDEKLEIRSFFTRTQGAGSTIGGSYNRKVRLAGVVSVTIV